MNKLSSFLLCAAVAVCPLAAKSKGSTTLQPVNLGAASTFAVLAETGVTADATHTVINGDLGLYPAAGTYITGFSGENAATNCCGIVNGKIDDTGPGEPTKETSAASQAILSLGAAIADAKSRACPSGQVIPCVLTITELGGRTFTPGVYKYAGVATLTADVTLSGAGVYIFQLDALTVSGAGSVVLKGATAANVFWVGTQFTLGSNGAFAGTILSTTAITFTAGAPGTVLTGRALAQANVTFAADDTVTVPK